MTKVPFSFLRRHSTSQQAPASASLINKAALIARNRCNMTSGPASVQLPGYVWHYKGQRMPNAGDIFTVRYTIPSLDGAHRQALLLLDMSSVNATNSLLKAMCHHLMAPTDRSCSCCEYSGALAATTEAYGTKLHSPCIDESTA